MGHWGHLDVVGDMTIADFTARVIQAWELAVLIEPTTYEIFALGRPSP